MEIGYPDLSGSTTCSFLILATLLKYCLQSEYIFFFFSYSIYFKNFSFFIFHIFYIFTISIFKYFFLLQTTNFFTHLLIYSFTYSSVRIMLLYPIWSLFPRIGLVSIHRGVESFISANQFQYPRTWYVISENLYFSFITWSNFSPRF